MIAPVETQQAPAAIGPYSQAIRAGDFLFISGQIPLDPVSGQIVPGDVSRQTQQAISNLAAIVSAAGGTLGSIVKTTVYVRDLSRFEDINRAYEAAFAPHRPARATIQVSGLPKDAEVEIEAVAHLPL